MTKIPITIKRKVIQRDRGRCTICQNEKGKIFSKVIVENFGGINTTNNVVVLCSYCIFDIEHREVFESLNENEILCCEYCRTTGNLGVIISNVQFRLIRENIKIACEKCYDINVN